ncbi:hypothetical protein [Phaeodactylibacter xiamenensis]|uniref:hypothetical protein n=1 Tax=Phaeodactylibacter xiamenensis TaxID=1524460 RepID=UPI0024A7E315|nr:hypothetical protein [Phaeodactylibacter xiamenensis]
MEGLQQLTEALQRHTQVMEQYIRIEREKMSPWCDPEQAAEILGISITSSRKHRRKLSAMIDRGLITKFRDGRPPMYWKEELQALAVKRAAGQVNY